MVSKPKLASGESWPAPDSCSRRVLPAFSLACLALLGSEAVASGYRGSETRELRITVNYLPALQQSDLEIAEFQVVIPLSEIASARRFDPDAYELLNRINRGETGASAESAA